MFIAQVYGVDLGLGAFVTVILTATLASVGTAAVPGVGLITLALVLEQAGLPVEGIALIIGLVVLVIVVLGDVGTAGLLALVGTEPVRATVMMQGGKKVIVVDADLRVAGALRPLPAQSHARR